MPKAYPVYDAEYRGHLDIVRAHIDKIPNLHTVGRNGMHKYNNQDHSMLTAMMTVANMRGTASHDVWAVNTDYEYHEEQKIEGQGTTPNGSSGTSGGGSGSSVTPPAPRRASAPGMRASVGA
jgi:hypothetical protein